MAIPMGGGRTLWRWTDADIAKGRKVKATQKPGPKAEPRNESSAIYARVSTTNHGQDVTLQTRELEQFAAGTRLADRGRVRRRRSERDEGFPAGTKPPDRRRAQAAIRCGVRLALRQVRSLRLSLAAGS